jgi:hypothetical protein
MIHFRSLPTAPSKVASGSLVHLQDHLESVYQRKLLSVLVPPLF